MRTVEQIMELVSDYASEIADIASSESVFAHIGKSRYAYRDKTLAALRTAIEELHRDARRYSWLASNAYVGIAPHPKPHEVWCLRLPNPNNCANLDAAIDAAREST